MPKKFILTLTIILGLLLRPAAAAASGQNFLLLFSSNVHGETEPCG
ncbi:MAG: hypothetical protein GXP59_09070 [Deltaproteobacteria bacterium]|nr:hypothetical protein [Deltaproteobacteria bacterium]